MYDPLLVTNALAFHRPVLLAKTAGVVKFKSEIDKENPMESIGSRAFENSSLESMVNEMKDPTEIEVLDEVRR